jgi:predicted HD phosphohydrolase
LLKALVTLDEGLSRYQITRLGHSVQSATRAWRDGANIDWVVSALLNGIGNIFARYNHHAYAAAILKPFIREHCIWVLEKYGNFQMIYYDHDVGGNPNKRNHYQGHPYFDDCAIFFERWDQSSFDPDSDNLPVDFFTPMVCKVFNRTPYDTDVIRAGAQEPLVNPAVAGTR